MKLHPRTQIVSKAQSELVHFMLTLEQKHGLTYGELVKILSLRVADLAKYMIRDERHPDSDKRGDED